MAGRKQIVLAGAIGNIVEWYDFGLYGLLAPTLASLFFPPQNHMAALLNVYGGFAVGFGMRPIGAIVLGRIGDRRGRQFVLVLSVVLMGAATLMLGLLPTYRFVGIWAAFLLIAIRLLQGFSVGGEFVGSVTYLVETAPEGRRGISGSVANLGATVGMLLAGAAAALAQADATRFWRYPFLFGGFLAFIGYMLRRHLPPEEQQIENAAGQKSADRVAQERAASQDFVSRWPVLQAFREIPRTMVIAMLFTCGYGISNYLTMVFLPAFAHEFSSIDQGEALWINTAAQGLILLVVPLAGWTSDHWIRRRTLASSAFLLQAALAWLLFRGVLHDGVAGLWPAQLLLAALLAVVMGTAPALLSEQFRPEYRVSGHSLVLNVGIGIAGGTSPMVALALIHSTGSKLAAAAYLTMGCAISGFSALLLQDSSRRRQQDREMAGDSELDAETPASSSLKSA